MRAIVNMQTVSSRTSEREAMSRALAHLARTLERKPAADRDNVL
jgi:zinc transporter 9